MKSLNKSEDDFLLQITEKAYERESDENRERLLLEILNLTRKGQLDFEKCAQDPKFAAEQFKTTLNQLQQLLNIANIKEMQSFLEDENNSTPIQLKIAKLLMDKPQ